MSIEHIQSNTELLSSSLDVCTASCCIIISGVPLGISMSDSISKTIADSEELWQVSAREEKSVAEALNKILSNHLGWPYRVRAGSAIDVDGLSTEEFSTLIYLSAPAAPQGAYVCRQPAYPASNVWPWTHSRSQQVENKSDCLR